jgi:hypothetical protein
VPSSPLFALLSRTFTPNRYTAMSPAEVTEKLALHKMKDRSWYVHPRYVPSWPFAIFPSRLPVSGLCPERVGRPKVMSLAVSLR